MNIIEKAIRAREMDIAAQEEAEQRRKERQKAEDIQAASICLEKMLREILEIEEMPEFTPSNYYGDGWTVSAEIDGRTFRINRENYKLEVYVAAEMRPGYGDGQFVEVKSLGALGQLFIDEAAWIKRRDARKGGKED